MSQKVHNRCVLWSLCQTSYFRKQIVPELHTYPLKNRPLHISHTSVILNLPNFTKNSLNNFDWTKLDSTACVAVYKEHVRSKSMIRFHRFCKIPLDLNVFVALQWRKGQNTISNLMQNKTDALVSLVMELYGSFVEA